MTHVSKYSSNIGFAVVAAIAIVSLSFLSFVLAEPQISHSQTEDFTIRQTITDEATFLVPPTDVTMAGNISGITGGNSTGTSQFVVRTNAPGGYFVNIDFGNAANTYVGQYAMSGDSTGSEDIADYRFGNAVPSYNYIPEGGATFGYTVVASTSDHISASFQHNGIDTCGIGSNTTSGFCWATPSSTDFEILNSGDPAPTGATSTITFKVNVPSNPTPIPAAESYTATATLSLFTQ